MAEVDSPLRRFSTWRICSREQAKSECDWAGDVVSVCHQPIKVLLSVFARTNSPSGKPALLLFLYARSLRSVAELSFIELV